MKQLQEAFRRIAKSGIEWRRSSDLVAYEPAVQTMEQRVTQIYRREAREMIWLLEHPPLFTAGTSAAEDELTGTIDLPVFKTGRGGRYTYHGPGQRIAYTMLDLKRLGTDVRRFVWMLEEWIIQTLSLFGINAERRHGRVGAWVIHRNQESKIAALGVRLRRWISFHGISINIDPNLDHFNGIIPCGIRGYGVTSLQEMGLAVTIEEIDDALAKCFSSLFLNLTTSQERGTL